MDNREAWEPVGRGAGAHGYAPISDKGIRRAIAERRGRPIMVGSIWERVMQLIARVEAEQTDRKCAIKAAVFEQTELAGELIKKAEACIVTLEAALRDLRAAPKMADADACAAYIHADNLLRETGGEE